MRLDSDIVLIGTGIAPLVAAQQFIQQGKTVLILNPEFDFFGENSELPFDPHWPWNPRELHPVKIDQSQFEVVFSELQPEYPGPLESWPLQRTGFKDHQAPYVRARSRLWMKSLDEKSWSQVEEMYVKASDAGFKPQLLEGLLALNRFPGLSVKKATDSERSKGILFPKMADVDVKRFRNGVREFMKERLGDERMVTHAGPIELMDDAVRFRQEGISKTVRVNESVFIFWTPRLTHWIISLCKRFEVKPILPTGVRVWEDWSLVSKDPVDPSIIGAMDDLLAWADFEGEPEESNTYRLGVLCAGPKVPMESNGLDTRPAESNWASSGSFQRISRFCHEFLKWNKFTVRSMQARAILEWEEEPRSFILTRGTYEARVFNHADGALSQVVKMAKLAGDPLR
jgi:hypothetical protein